MNRRALTDRSTLRLAKEFIKCSKEFERVAYANWWLHPWRWVSKGWRKGRLSQQRTDIVGELSVRYEGMLYQLFQRAGNNSDFSSFVQAVWRAIQITALTMRDENGFSKTIWEAYGTHSSSQSRELKPKLMLRQFVDEMSPHEERAALRILAYRMDTASRPDDRESLRLLQRSYPLLHQELLRCSDDLLDLSDREFLPDVINGLSTPFTEYRDWLFFR